MDVCPDCVGAGLDAEELNTVGPLVGTLVLVWLLLLLELLFDAKPEPTDALGFVARVVPDCMAQAIPLIT